MSTALALKAPDDLDIIWPSDDERARLEAIIGPYYQAALEAINTILRRTLRRRITPNTLIVRDTDAARILREAASRVVRIDETTRQAIRTQLEVGQLRGYSNWQIAHGVPSDGYRGIDGLFTETWRGRAETVARTEMQHASVVSSIDRFAASGVVDRVRIIDGDDDRPCNSRNGTTVALEQAPGLAHPNCTLVLEPVVREGVEQEAPPPRAWGEWGTLEQAQHDATVRYPNVKFDFTGASLDTISPTLRQFDRLARQYPQVAERLEYFGTYGGPNAPRFPGADDWGANTWAHATRDGKNIGLNPAWYGDGAKFRESLRISEESGFHPKGNNSVESVITHEFGHQVENWLRSVDSHIAAFDVVDIGGNGLVGATFDRWYQKHSTTRRLSKYATSSSEEGWAESFAAQYHAPADVQRLVYVQRQRELLKALDPDNWRHEAGLVESVGKLSSALSETEPGSPAYDITRRALDAARRRLEATPAGEWRWQRDLPPDERMGGRERLDRWLRQFDL